MRFIVTCFLFSLAFTLKTYAQQGTTASQGSDTSVNGQQKQHLPFLDSVACLAMQLQQQQAQDSLTSLCIYVRRIPSVRIN